MKDLLHAATLIAVTYLITHPRIVIVHHNILEDGMQPWEDEEAIDRIVQLTRELDEAERLEDYERAAEIRDELKRL